MCDARHSLLACEFLGSRNVSGLVTVPSSAQRPRPAQSMTNQLVQCNRRDGVSWTWVQAPTETPHRAEVGE